MRVRKKDCRKRRGVREGWSRKGWEEGIIPVWAKTQRPNDTLGLNKVDEMQLWPLSQCQHSCCFVCAIVTGLQRGSCTAWCLPQAPQIEPQANNELSIRQWNLKDEVVSFPDSMACVSVNTEQIALFEFNRGFCVSFLSARWNFQLLIANTYSLLAFFSLLFFPKVF